jgi:nicotinate-nucleotide adenylyltransferase
MKIAIMGGTFDPPHIGHLVIADQAFAQLGLDKVWFAPVGEPPHKNIQHVSPVEHRAAMTSLAIQDNAHFELTRADIERPTPHYITTLFELLCQREPQHEWYLIMGGDSLMELPRWHEPMRLLQLAKLAVAHRPGFQPDLQKLEAQLPGVSARIAWVDSPMIDLASRDLQRRAREGLPLRYVVTQEVARYIDEHKLYSEPATVGSQDARPARCLSAGES